MTDTTTTVTITQFWCTCLDAVEEVTYWTARRFGKSFAEPAPWGKLTFQVPSGEAIRVTLPAWLTQRAVNQKRGLQLDVSSSSVT